MKTILIVLLALPLFCCKEINLEKNEKALLPEEEKRRIFYSIMDTVKSLRLENDTFNTFYNFYKDYYPYNIEAYSNYGQNAILYYGLKEELINPSAIDTKRIWARCLVGKMFNPPYIISIEKIGQQYYLNTKVINVTDSFGLTGKYKYLFPGEENTRVIDSTLGAGFFSYIESSTILTDTTKYKIPRRLDGADYEFEAIINGRYIKIDLYDNYTATIKELPENRFEIMMRKLDELFDSTATGKRRLKMIEDYYNEHPNEKR